MKPINADNLLRNARLFLQETRVFMALIEAEPVLDVTLVIPCKRCKYFKYGDYCTHDKMEHSHCDPDDYCSYVELREESDTENEWED